MYQPVRACIELNINRVVTEYFFLFGFVLIKNGCGYFVAGYIFDFFTCCCKLIYIENVESFERVH